MIGTEILEEKDSPYNGRITVIRSIAWGTYIQVEGITQSGGIIEDVWKSVLNQVVKTKRDVRRVLILGLGGGTVAKLVNKLYPEASIVGVDIDQTMVDLGKKFLHLSDLKIEIKINDAEEFINNNISLGEQYDLILIDMYLGQGVPEKFTSASFGENIKKLLNDKGLAIFNRLYFGDKRTQAVKFGDKLEKIFSKVEYIYPEANVMFICLK